MQVTRTILAAVLLVAATVGVPLAAVAVANAARPVIPAQPAAPADAAAEVPAMPEPPATIRPLAAQFKKLPLVASGPNAARPFVEAYRTVPVEDAAAAADLIDVAFAELTVAPSDRAMTREFVDALVLEPVEEEDPDANVDDGSEVPVVGPFDTPKFHDLSERALGAIAADPSNAPALNDLAVAISTAALADPSLLPNRPEGGPPIASSGQLVEAAIRLLELGRASFPTDRPDRHQPGLLPEPRRRLQ